jgi:hypothetical protein
MNIKLQILENILQIFNLFLFKKNFLLSFSFNLDVASVITYDKTEHNIDFSIPKKSMLPCISDVREGFICPQCHQDMSTMEMLQIHFQDVHLKQSASTVKGRIYKYELICIRILNLGLFSFAKQKIKSVQDNFTTNPNEQLNSYAQFFSSDQSDLPIKQQIGYTCSYNDTFKKIRKTKLDQLSIETTRLLLRLERLTSTDEHVPKNANTKERRSTNLYFINKNLFFISYRI